MANNININDDPSLSKVINDTWTSNPSAMGVTFGLKPGTLTPRKSAMGISTIPKLTIPEMSINFPKSPNQDNTPASKPDMVEQTRTRGLYPFNAHATPILAQNQAETQSQAITPVTKPVTKPQPPKTGQPKTDITEEPYTGNTDTGANWGMNIKPSGEKEVYGKEGAQNIYTDEQGTTHVEGRGLGGDYIDRMMETIKNDPGAHGLRGGLTDTAINALEKLAATKAARSGISETAKAGLQERRMEHKEAMANALNIAHENADIRRQHNEWLEKDFQLRLAENKDIATQKRLEGMQEKFGFNEKDASGETVKNRKLTYFNIGLSGDVPEELQHPVKSVMDEYYDFIAKGTPAGKQLSPVGLLKAKQAFINANKIFKE